MLNILFFYLMFTACKGQEWYTNNLYQYHFGSYVRNFITAESQCQKFNSNLVVIRDKLTNDFLKSKITQINDRSNYYIGLQRVNNSKTGFKWVDGTPVLQGYTDWGIGEPNNGFISREDCAFMWKNKGYKWNDDQCATGGRYICQRKIVTTTVASSSSKNDVASTPRTVTTLLPSSDDNKSVVPQNATKTIESKEDKKQRLILYLIPTLSILFVLLVVILVVLICRRRQNNLKSSINKESLVNEISKAISEDDNPAPIVYNTIQHDPLDSIYAAAEDPQTSNAHVYTTVDKKKGKKNEETSETQQKSDSSSVQYENMGNNPYDNLTFPQNTNDTAKPEVVYNALEKDR